jgi:hypothetical protein
MHKIKPSVWTGVSHSYFYISLYVPSTGFLCTPVYCCAAGEKARYGCGCPTFPDTGVYDLCPGYAGIVDDSSAVDSEAG